MLDEAADQAATQAAALVINRMREALKAAIRDLLKELLRDATDYVLHHKLIRIILGLITLFGLIGYYLRHT